MIEQTALVVTEWKYYGPDDFPDDAAISENTLLDVMKKRAPTKKGIACRFSTYFSLNNKDILTYVADNSYVIDLDDVIDKKELLSMIRNTYNEFKERFDLRKLGTVLQDITLKPLEENKIHFESILPMLV
ncbi:MAG: hypothetical protein ABIW38_01795 [Ferruginibacter sp.]